MYTLANSEDVDEMPQNVAFHQGLHCLLRQKQFSEKEIQYYLEIITCDPLLYTKGHCCIKAEGRIHCSQTGQNYRSLCPAKIQLFQKIPSGTPSEFQTVWIQTRTDILSVLIWVQTVCKKLSVDDKSRASKKIVNNIRPDLDPMCWQIFSASDRSHH